jgi:hypothetical protein
MFRNLAARLVVPSACALSVGGSAFCMMEVEKPKEQHSVKYNNLISMDQMNVIDDATQFVAYAPNVPPAITRKNPAKLVFDMTTVVRKGKIDATNDYELWTINGSVPGPIIRCKVGDVLEVHNGNLDATGMGHNIDFHAAIGPGGGANLTYVELNQKKTAWFRMTQPGLFIYHCAAAPVPAHIANGMYGLVLVEPEVNIFLSLFYFHFIKTVLFNRKDSQKSTKNSMSSNPNITLNNPRKALDYWNLITRRVLMKSQPTLFSTEKPVL